MTLTMARIDFNGRTLEIETHLGGVIARAWAGKRWYEFPLLEYIRDLRLHGTVVDAGANVGNHTLWFALACNLQVKAFEPLHYEVLWRNVVRNTAQELVSVYPVALGDSEQVAEHLGKGMFKVGSGEIPVRTLDSYQLNHVAMIKADVEFMEPDVLRGGMRTIQRDHPIIFAEVHPGHEAALAAVLVPLQYKRFKRFRSKFNPTPIEEWRYSV